MRHDLQDWRLWVPAISGFTLSMLCPVSKEEGDRLPQTPPAWVFPIIWLILYVLIGMSWKMSNSHSDESKREADVMHGVLVGTLILWMLVYSCRGNKLGGVYILAVIFACTICCMSLHAHALGRIMLTPLVAWTFIAFHLNYHIVD